MSPSSIATVAATKVATVPRWSAKVGQALGSVGLAKERLSGSESGHVTEKATAMTRQFAVDSALMEAPVATTAQKPPLPRSCHY